MDKIFKKSIKYIISICLLICCAFSMTACMGGGGSSGGGGPSSGNSSTGSTNKPSDDKTQIDFDASEFEDDIAKNFMGAVCIYDVAGDKEVFYDSLQSKKTSFNALLERQFDVLATYIYSSLNKIYGEANSHNGVVNIKSADNHDFGNVEIAGALESSQKVYAGYSTGISVTNADKINYQNAISGDYEPVVITKQYDPDGNLLTQEDIYGGALVDKTKTQYEIKYQQDTSNTSPWAGKDYFTLENIENYLKRLYYNLYINQERTLFNSVIFDDNIALNYDKGELKNIYNSIYVGTDYSTNYCKPLEEEKWVEINVIGFDRTYMWHTLYFLTYAMVGETNFTISNASKGVTSTAIDISDGTLNTDAQTALKNYKGYDEVLKNIVEGAFNLTKASSGVEYGDYFSGANWNNTLYPRLDRREYVYYDDIKNISDAVESEFNVDDMEIPEADTSQKDFGDIDFGEFDVDDTQPGSAKRLREIYFIPKPEGDELVDVNGVMLGFKNFASNDKIEIDILYTGVYDSNISEDKVVEMSDKEGNGFTIENNRLSLDNSDANTGYIMGYFNYTGEKDGDEEDSSVDDLEVPEADTSQKDFSDIEMPEDETRDPDRLFGTAEHSIAGLSIDDLFSSSFKIEETTEKTTDTVINYGTLNTHNQLFKLTSQKEETTVTEGSENYTIEIYSHSVQSVLTKNYFRFQFKYSVIDGVGAPLLYLMHFDITDL